MSKRPPKAAEWMLNKISLKGEQFSAVGDFAEAYGEIAQNAGIAKAVGWYWLQIIISLPAYINYTLLRSFVMYKNYIKIALRNFKNHKSFAAINMSSLALGLASCTLIFLYVQDELSFDKFHDNKDNIYRLNTGFYAPQQGNWSYMGITPMPIVNNLKENFPEVDAFSRIFNADDVVKFGDKVFNEQITFVDPDFLTLFSFPLVSGNRNSVLADKNDMVISQSIAAKYFGNENALGKILQVKLGSEIHEFTVTGIADDIPDNSSIKFDILMHYDNLAIKYSPRFMRIKFAFRTATYLQLGEGTNFRSLEEKFVTYFQDMGYDSKQIRYTLQPLLDVYLNTTIDSSVEPNGNIRYSYILLIIAALVIGVASINFMNLSIARSTVRFKEIGMRKILGADRQQVLKQFWVESIILAMFSLLLGLCIAFFVLPVFNELSDKTLSLHGLLTTINISGLVLFSIIIGTLAGAYPALVLSGFHPINVLKGKLRFGSTNVLKRSMVVLQFALSILLITGTFFMNKQIQFMKNQNLGYYADQLIGFSTNEDEQAESFYERFKTELADRSEILGISSSFEGFGRSNTYSFTKVSYAGGEIATYAFKGDYDLFDVMGVELLEGRTFSRDFSSDPAGAIVVNESFVNALSTSNIYDTSITMGSFEGKIIGVIKDFHFNSLHREIGPALFHMRPNYGTGYIYLRVAPTNVSDVIALAEKTWKTVSHNLPFDYYFLDEAFAEKYGSEEKWSRIIGYSSILAVFIASLGLLGLASLSVNQRMKEVGIRKALGASPLKLINLLNREYTLLVLAANIIAMPTAYYVMSNWVQSFAYRITIDPLIFIASGLLALVIAVATVSSHTIVLALKNPVQTLRDE